MYWAIAVIIILVIGMIGYVIFQAKTSHSNRPLLHSCNSCFDSSCRQYWKAEMLKAKMAKDVAQGKQGVIARCDRLRKGCSHLIGPSSREGRETPVPEAPLVAVTKIKS